MKESLRVTLKYTGKDVDDGTMSIEDIIPVLQGFASAYGKVVSNKGFTSEHKLRIVGVEGGSFDILLEAWEWIGAHSDQIQAISAMLGGGAFTVVTIILGVIQLKKHTGNQPYTEKITGADNTLISVKNSKNVTIEIPVDVFQLFKERILDPDLAKIAKPLEKGRVDSAEIKVIHKKKELKEKITFDEKIYFDTETVSITKTKELWLVGAFNSLTKSTNKGFFILNDGTRVTYRFANENPEELYPYFLYKGPVKVKCKAHIDENLKVTLLDVFEVQKLQAELFNKQEEK
ncbi:MAG: hypothetical protein IB617_02200 [Candidatus Nealsonbacteria bacterium]|nr:MAG: hypothetical protein IB617_02200 [Candidatus Nealsonbacteria bacterium]